MNTSQTDINAQPLMRHLLELRAGLLRAVLGLIFVFTALYGFANEIYLIVSEPLRQLLPSGSSMIATDVASPFFTPFKLTLVVSLFIAMPYVIYEAWRFIAPGLYEREKQLSLPLLVFAIFLFYAGVVFAYFVVFPLIFGFFTSTGPEGVKIMTDISQYLDFVIKLLFAFGLAFEISVAVILFIALGITDKESLVAKRGYIVVVCFVVGMLLTPPDVISQVLLALPMWVLFELGLICSAWISSRPSSSLSERA